MTAVLSGKEAEHPFLRRVLHLSPSSWNKESKSKWGSTGKNRATFSQPPSPPNGTGKKQPGQLLVRSSSSFIFARFLDPPATKSQLIYNDPIFTLPLPRRRFTVPVRPSLFIDPRRERKRRGEKKESSFSPPRIIRYLFRTKRSRAVSYPVHPPPFFFSPSDHDSSPRTRSSGL